MKTLRNPRNRLLLILMSALTVVAGCAQDLPVTQLESTTDESSYDPNLDPGNYWAEDISADLDSAIREFEDAPIGPSTRNPSYSSGLSVHSNVPATPRPQIALVPHQVEGPGVSSFYLFINDTSTGQSGAHIVEVVDRRDNNRFRIYSDTRRTSVLELILDDDGRIIDLDGDLGPGKWGPDWECVATRIITMINLGQATGLSEACIAACTAGGPANPTCIACVIGIAGTIGFIIWDCW